MARAVERLRPGLAMACLTMACLAVAGLGLPPQAKAQGWVFQLFDSPVIPPRFLVIDKQAQTFFHYRKESPLTVLHRLPCATGQAEGDKSREGDLRTPEGVYFIERRLASGLDYSLYGDLAFTLNFPNPVDVINKKTGHGIWIHGRGHNIVPNETRGCVALNTADLKLIDETLAPGMPVIIADRVDASTKADDQEAQLMVSQTQAWAKAWESRSDRFFEFYDPDRFALSEGKPFSNFREHKRNLFQRYDYIKIELSDVRAVKGPNYWVTFFGQSYRTPTVEFAGIKRLYWMRDASDKWRIVGNEWTELAQAKRRTQVASDASGQPKASSRGRSETSEEASPEQEVLEVINQWRAAWERGDLKAYMAFYDKRAVQGGRKGSEEIESQKRVLWSEKKPRRVVMENLKTRVKSGGVEVEFRQVYQAADGSGDKGVKTMLLVKRGDAWRILREDWEGS